MVCHALRQAGIEVDYCSSATAGRYKVVLVSITSGCDWYPFIGERLAWAKTARPVVIAGGAGLLNVRPFLRWCDTFCLGRSEEYVVPVVRASLAGERHEHPSVIHAADFDVNKTHILDAGTSLYPHPVPLANGKTWRETAYGCQRRMVSGEKSVPHWRSRSLPSLMASVARRRFWDSFRMRRLWPSFSRRMRFSVRRYSITSCCWRFVQAAMATTMKCQGSRP
jgi:hypothetical protein